MVPREAYKPIVYAAQQAGTVGCAGLYGTGAATHGVHVEGIEEWIAVFGTEKAPGA